MESQFSERIRRLRESQKLYLRQVAPLLEMDTAQLSKIEKGLRQMKKEQIPILANILRKTLINDVVTGKIKVVDNGNK